MKSDRSIDDISEIEVWNDDESYNHMVTESYWFTIHDADRPNCFNNKNDLSQFDKTISERKQRYNKSMYDQKAYS